jgi:carbamate kinase
MRSARPQGRHVLLVAAAPVTAASRTGTAVVAVGGNALTRPDQLGRAEEIAANAADMAGALTDLVRAGRRVAVVHGNGPQVGNLALQQDALAATVPAQPLHQLSAMTQGQLGGVLARAIDAECGAGAAVCVVTHVVVEAADPAFVHPAKPIGPFLDRREAEGLARERGWRVVEDAGRGWRRVVPSPQPIGIVELAAVGTLLAAGTVVLAAGGGGIAVSAEQDGRLTPLDAVIDKDLAAAALATAVGADELYLLTGVDCVLLDHGTPRQRPVHRLEPEEAERHLAAGQFPPGSMGPKITAALAFLRDGGHRAIITSPRLLRATADGVTGAGTCIERSPVPMARLS